MTSQYKICTGWFCNRGHIRFLSQATIRSAETLFVSCLCPSSVVRSLDRQQDRAADGEDGTLLNGERIRQGREHRARRAMGTHGPTKAVWHGTVGLCALAVLCSVGSVASIPRMQARAVHDLPESGVANDFGAVLRRSGALAHPKAWTARYRPAYRDCSLFARMPQVFQAVH